MFTTLALVSTPWAGAGLLFVVGIGMSYSSAAALPVLIAGTALGFDPRARCVVAGCRLAALREQASGARRRVDSARRY